MRLIDADAFLMSEMKRCDGEMPYIGTCTTNNFTLKSRIENAPTIEPPPNLCAICKWREWATTHIGEIKEDK